jgi:uncharacterized membrane protein
MLFALLIGFVNGARTFAAPAVTAWAATLGLLDVRGSSVAFLGMSATAVILTALALLELWADKQPGIPSRRSAGPLLVRLAAGGLCGTALGAHAGAPATGATLGALGAVAGTFATFAARARLAGALGRDLPAALIEDAAVIALAVAAVLAVAP